MKRDKQSVKKSCEMSDESVEGMSAIIGVLVAILVCGPGNFTSEKTQSMVVQNTKDTLFVRNLKDTTKYHVLTRQDNLKYDLLRAFDYVASGDTLNFYVQPCDGTKIENVKDINSKTVAKFVKLKREQQISDSNRARIR